MAAGVVWNEANDAGQSTPLALQLPARDHVGFLVSSSPVLTPQHSQSVFGPKCCSLSTPRSSLGSFTLHFNHSSPFLDFSRLVSIGYRKTTLTACKL
jgi:hypothetical protein